jgi:hypothetical protein
LATFTFPHSYVTIKGPDFNLKDFDLNFRGLDFNYKDLGFSQASSYLVTKHSWKGKYRRVLTLSQDGFSTYNPNSMEPTNTWKITDVVGLTPAPSTAGGPSQTPGTALEFQVIFVNQGTYVMIF